MKWNPYVNAVGASAYICLIVLLLQYISSVRGNTPDSIVDPIGAISLLVFSVALMGFLFFYRPVVLLLEHQREAAVEYFLKTLGTFGCITLLVFVVISAL